MFRLRRISKLVAPARKPHGEMVMAAVDVAIELGGRKIISDASFELHAGEVMAIVGPNGAGKSTLLAALAGDLPYSGSITIDGQEVKDWSNRQLALRRTVLRQNNSISFPFNVVDVVKMARAPWQSLSSVEEDDRIIVQELLRTDTYQFADRKFTTLSGGERARVSLARAMAQRTQVLLLDEPTAALDINYQEQVLALARRYARQGGAVIVVQHDLSAAAAYSDQILIINEGTIRHIGTPTEVLTSELITEVYRHPVRAYQDTHGELTISPVRFPDEPPSGPGKRPEPSSNGTISTTHTTKEAT